MPFSYLFMHVEKGVSKNPNNTIVIKNKEPTTGTGRSYDIGVYKNQSLLVVQKDVHVMDQIDFKLEPKLTFAVARDIEIKETFTSAEITSFKATFDLSDYPNGIDVTLTQIASSGEYMFSAAQPW